MSAYAGRRVAPNSWGWGRRIAVIVLSAVALLSGLTLLAYYLGNTRTQARFDALAKAVHAPIAAPAEQLPADQAPAETVPSALEQLQQQNSHLTGWITVPGTRIDYPVMHTPDQPQYYLRRDFDGGYALSGTPFLDGGCTLESGNLILWGHNMKSGTMFADLLLYQNPKFASEHTSFTLETLQETRTYEVVAAFRSEVDQEGDYFRWYNFTDLPDQRTFDAFAAGLRAVSLLPVPENLSFGDSFLTMATCSYHDDNGRFVVVGRQLTDQP